MAKEKHNYPYNQTILTNFAAELFSTALFVFTGCGAAILAGPAIGALGIAIAFASAMFFTAILFSGFHRVQFNPGLTIAIYLCNIDLKSYSEEHNQYWFFHGRANLTAGWVLLKIAGQLIGAILGAALLLVLILTNIHHIDPAKLGLSQNGWGVGFQSEFTVWGAILVEVVGSLIIFYAITRSVRNYLTPIIVAIVGAIAFLAIHLLAYPVTGASLNFARSVGPEIVSFLSRFGRLEDGLGSDVAFTAFCNSLLELGVFLLASLLAGLVAGVLSRNIYPESDRDRR